MTEKILVLGIVLSILFYECIQGLSNLFILYGKRRFALAIVLSYLLNLAVVATGLLPFPVGVIGLLVPGIMVREMEKQGVGKTLLALAAVTGILAAVMLLMGAL